MYAPPSKQVFEPGVVLADGDFSGLESVILGAPLEMTNNYMDAVAYNEVLCAPGYTMVYFEVH